MRASADASSPAPRGRRDERTAASRAQILDAAVACLVESGYAGATTLQIQARAGVSRGRLLHHFPSREQLLVAASQHLSTQRLRRNGERIKSLAGGLTGAERLDRAIELMWEAFSEPHFWAAVELWTAARTNKDLRAALLVHEREIGAAIKAGLDRFYGPELVAHPRYPAGPRPAVHQHARGGARLRAGAPRPEHRPPSPPLETNSPNPPDLS